MQGNPPRRPGGREVELGNLGVPSVPASRLQRPNETIVKVIRPEGVRPGDMIDVSTPLGYVRCTIPEGVECGGAFHVTAPL